jgi:integrase
MLNDTQLKALKPKEKVYNVTDSLGLSVQVETTGSKLWRFRYQFENKPKLISLGKYPDISLLQARERRDEARKLVANGIDPSKNRKEVKSARLEAQANSFKQVSEEWYAHWQQDKHGRHADYVMRRLEADVFPVIGNRAISQIQAPEIVAVIKAIAGRGALDIAKRCHQTIGQIFRFAIAHGKATRNPATDINPGDIIPPRRKENYARINEADLPELIRSIHDYSGTPITRLAMLLMYNTFVRTSELIGARWQDFDLNKNQWKIPARIEDENGNKIYGMKMDSDHIVPLSKQALSILERIRAISGENELLFPSTKGEGKSMSNNTILKALERMGYKRRMTGHGFRGLASTILHEQGYNHAHIELQLAHTERNTVSAAYNHALYLPQRTKMMQEWSDYLDSLMNKK